MMTFLDILGNFKFKIPVIYRFKFLNLALKYKEVSTWVTWCPSLLLFAYQLM